MTTKRCYWRLNVPVLLLKVIELTDLSDLWLQLFYTRQIVISLVSVEKCGIGDVPNCTGFILPKQHKSRFFFGMAVLCVCVYERVFDVEELGQS